VPEMAEEIAREVIEKNLAASVTAVPGVRRMYKQDSEIKIQQDTLLLIQTLKGKLQELTDFIASVQFPNMPAIIALSITEGNKLYMKWAEENLKEEV
jgi:periplasmic divalent cation tolerance protein